MAYSAFESAFVAILFTKTTSWDGERTRRRTGCDGERTTTERGPRREAGYDGARTEAGGAGYDGAQAAMGLSVKAPATANRYAAISLLIISTSSISSLAIIRLRLFKPITYR